MSDDLPESISVEEAFELTISLFKDLQKDADRMKLMLKCRYQHQATFMSDFICTKCGYSEAEWRKKA